MNICIGGDLDGQVVILNKMRFNAKERGTCKTPQTA